MFTGRKEGGGVGAVGEVGDVGVPWSGGVGCGVGGVAVCLVRLGGEVGSWELCGGDSGVLGGCEKKFVELVL